jgi:hypothetical protein
MGPKKEEKKAGRCLPFFAAFHWHWRLAGGMEGGDSPQEGGEERNGEKQEQAMGPKKEEEEKAGKSPPFSLLRFPLAIRRWNGGGRLASGRRRGAQWREARASDGT